MKKIAIFAAAVSLSGAVFAGGLEDFKSQSDLSALDMRLVNSAAVTMPLAAKSVEPEYFPQADDNDYSTYTTGFPIEGETDWDFLVRETALCGVNKLFGLDAVQLGDKEVRGFMKQYDSERFFVTMVTDSISPDNTLEPDNWVCRAEIGDFKPEYIVLLTAKAGDGSKLIRLNLDGTFVSAAKVQGMFGPVQYRLSEADVAELITAHKNFWKNYFISTDNPVSD